MVSLHSFNSPESTLNPNRYPLLYAAYGANTNFAAMRQRCPTAVYVGNVEIFDYRLVFRSVADVIPKKDAVVVCALWEIQAADEAALDRFESYPNFYGKRYADLRWKKRDRQMMFYIMNGPRRDRHEPPISYEQTLRQGYRDCRMPEDQLDAAISDARDSSRRELRYRGKWLDEDARRARREVAMSKWREGSSTYDWIDGVDSITGGN
jgi:gamma-glutamylcyclotransferase (GGCT)/AIG2-like uncharacterized protein YtfP